MASQTSISIRDGDIPRQSCSLTDSLGDVRIICEVTKETREIPVIDLDDSDDETPTKESDKQPESTSECSQPVPSSGAERIQNDPVEATSHSSLQPQVNSVNSDVSDLIINTDKGPHHRTEKINLTNASERIALTEKYNDEGQLFQTSNNRGQKRGNSHCSPASKVVVLFSPGLTHYNENIRLVRVCPQQHRENSNLASDVIHNNSKNLLLPHNSSVSLGTLSQNAEDGINSSVGSCASTTNGSTPANRLPVYARKTSGNGSPVSAERRDVNENLPLTGDNMKDKCPPKSDHTVSNSAMPLCLSHCETQLTRCSNTNSESSRLSLDVECLQLNRDKPISTVSESRKTTVDVLTSNHDTLPKTANTKSPISKTNGADSTVFGRGK